MAPNDRLFDELLRPIVDDYYEAAKDFRAAGEANSGPRLALLARMNCLQECGTRTARILGVAEPFWDGERIKAGLSW